MRKRLVLKIGSSTLTQGTHIISRGKVEDIARQLVALKDEYEILIVSSGAIATARQAIKTQGNDPIAVKQALAAIGQPILMRIYQEVFQDYGLRMAQCLLSHTDFERDSSKVNTQNTLEVLLANGYIPIINENDTTTTAEIRFGDNDYLAALVAHLVQAHLLILASNIEGLFAEDPQTNPQAKLIKSVRDISEVAHMVGPSVSSNGTGGMASKLKAAQYCQENGIELWILNGNHQNFLVHALGGIREFTRFLPIKENGGNNGQTF
ncbi:MAG: glutamate 5-kinase [Bacteroidota bacterium]